MLNHNKLIDCCTELNYDFKNIDLLKQALTRTSVHNERSNSFLDYNKIFNRRLEFLGDAVLRCIISDLLIEQYTSRREGFLSEERDKLVSNEGNSMLYHIAEMLNLNEFISFGKGEVLNKVGRSRALINAMEALIGAIFIDCGRDYSCISKFIDGHFNISRPLVIAESSVTQISPEGPRMIPIYNNQQRQTKCSWITSGIDAAAGVAFAIILPLYYLQKPKL